MNFRIGFFVLITFSILSVIALAEVSGTINFTIAGDTGIVTGLYGNTSSPYCTSSSNCASGDMCAIDWDGKSYGSYTGWCAPSSDNCANSSSLTATPEWHENNYKFCNGTWAVECSSSEDGQWGKSNCAASGYSCVDGVCISNDTATTTTPGSSNDDTTTTIASASSLKVTSSPSDFDITQGESVIKTITVKNNGQNKLYDVTISLSGIESAWYSLTKTKFSGIDVNSSVTYIINFSMHSNATVNTYDVTATMTASDSTAITASFKIRLMPSAETIETEIKPQYSACISVLDELERNITLIEQKGIDVTSLREILKNAMDKINQTKGYLDSGDYFTANGLIQETLSMIDDIKSKIAASEAELAGSGDSFIVVVVIIVLLIVGAVIAYLFWPEKYKPWLFFTERFGSAKKTSAPVSRARQRAPATTHKTASGRIAEIKELISRLKKAKKRENKEAKEKFMYEFKR